MLRVRIDDVLLKGSGGKDPVKRFAQITRWLEKSDKIKHVPTILVKDIQNYPETIDLIVRKTSEGKMFPELHGWEHVRYVELEESKIREDLARSFEWFQRVLGYTPKIWATPWGAENVKLHRIATEFGMTVEGVRNCVDPGQWINEAKKGKLNYDVTIMDHWWCRGCKLLRVAHIMAYGSFIEAAKHEDVLN